MTKLYLPGDKGWDPRQQYPWSPLNKLAAQLGKPEDSTKSIEIDGFFVKDTRQTPNIAIFKNCQMPLVEGRQETEDEPIPFMYMGEAMHYIKSLHLSQEDTKKMRIVALAADPGLGATKPDTIFVPKQALKER